MTARWTRQSLSTQKRHWQCCAYRLCIDFLSGKKEKRKHEEQEKSCRHAKGIFIVKAFASKNKRKIKLGMSDRHGEMFIIVYPLIHHQRHDKHYELCNVPLLPPFAKPHFYGYYSNSGSSLLLLFCWLIETDLRKENFRFGIYFDLGLIPCGRLLVRSERQAKARRRQAKKNKIKSKSNQSRLVQFVSFRPSRSFSNLFFFWRYSDSLSKSGERKSLV